MYISQVPTLFDPRYFQREENSLAAQFPVLLSHLSDSSGNKWPSSLA